MLRSGFGYIIRENKAQFSDLFRYGKGEDDNTKLRLDICDWLIAHGLEPRNVPLPCVLVRNVAKNYVAATHIERDVNGKVVAYIDSDGELCCNEFSHIEYLEGPPLPFPLFGFEEFQERFQL